ncbi:MAG: sugar ABC transporter permease [Chloroflexi bacterium]|nr:sugar ABC transporter permease [Chloroflexota bacterium]
MSTRVAARTLPRAESTTDRPRLRQSTRRSLWAYLFISPFYLTFLVFGVFPIGFSFYLAFTRWTPMESRWIGLTNFANLLQDKLVHQALFNSLWLMAVITVVQISLALGIAFVLSQSGIRFKDFFRAALFLPYITSSVVLGLVWGVILDSGGIANFALQTIGVGGIDWLGHNTGSGFWIKPAVALVTIWQFTGWNVILFAAGLQAIPHEIYEAARIDGANSWQILIQITLPMLRRIMFFVTSITIIGSVQIFDIPLMLLGGVGGAGQGTLGGAEAGGLTLSMIMYETAFSYGYFGYAATISLMLFVLLLILTVANKFFFFRDMEGA